MNLQDLDSLRLAVETNNPDYYNGQWATVLEDLLGHMEDMSNDTKLEDMVQEREEYRETIIDTFEDCKCVYDDKTEEYTLTPSDNMCTLTLPHDDLRDGEENYEIILRVIL